MTWLFHICSVNPLQILVNSPQFLKKEKMNCRNFGNGFLGGFVRFCETLEMDLQGFVVDL